MKVHPDVHPIKSATVALTKLEPANLPDGVTCNIQQRSFLNTTVSYSKPENASQVNRCSGEAKCRSVPSNTTDNSKDDSLGDKVSLDDRPTRNNDRKMAPPKHVFDHENTKTRETENHESSPKRRKLYFSTSININVEADVGEGNMTSNAKENISVSTDTQYGRKEASNVPIVVGMRFGKPLDKSHQPDDDSNEEEKNVGKSFRKIQHTNDIGKQDPGIKGTNTSATESKYARLSGKAVDEKPMQIEGNCVCIENEQSCESTPYAVKRHDSSAKRHTSNTDMIDCLDISKGSKKSKIKIENITAKLMREKQVACDIPGSNDMNTSPYLSTLKCEPLGPSTFTSIKSMNRQLSDNNPAHRTRKRPTQKQYVRCNSAKEVSLKEEVIPKERCSSVPLSSVSKLKETRKMLKTAISASAVSTKVEYATLEDWTHGIPKNVPNILVKSKHVPNFREISKVVQTATCSKSSTFDKMCTDTSKTASAELVRLQKIDSNESEEVLTKLKQKRNRKKQDETVKPGPSGYRKISGFVKGEGKQPGKSSDKPVTISDTERSTLAKALKSNALHVNNPNSFPYMKKFKLPVEGIQMKINRTSPKNRVALTYKNEIGSKSPISFKFSPKKAIDVVTEEADAVSTKLLPVKSATASKPLVQMGSFAISKSQEIFPVKSNESFLTPETKPNVTTPKRLIHAISYADYCAQMDDAEASEDAAKPRRTSEQDEIKATELKKNDAEIGDNINDPLQNDDTLLLKKLNQLHVGNTSCSVDVISSSPQSHDTVEVLDCSEEAIKQEKCEEPHKESLDIDDDDDDDDDDSVHLSDHRYTKTPEASPAKSLTKGILHRTSTQSGTVVMGNRAQISQGNCKQPVYAVKYGDKLFLIHGKDDSNKISVTGTMETKKEIPKFKPISPKVEIRTDEVIVNKDSPYMAKKNNHKVNMGKLSSKRKLDFVKQLVLNQKCLKRKKKKEKQPVQSCRSHRTSVIRNAKVVHIHRTKGRIQTTTTRVNITLTKGTDAEMKRWSRFADFKAQLTYQNDDNTLVHIKVDELQSGFYKLMPVVDLSNTRTVNVILSCLPPHPDIIVEGDSFIAVGPLHNVVNTGQDAKQTEEWSSSEFGGKLASLLPATAMCHGSLYFSDVSYRPKLDTHEWYGTGIFDIFTRKYCRQKRVVQRHKWNRNPYDKTFS
ncbi:uncharacterized protein LOC132546811 [Ylistrum balloti]|uniref:uncharacterized protein LOC132546811 n=1 Tax=Ylistrum balloti TaxID=509963 RepID=UPI002905D1F3|nr:uncharacterized protein LOC132546811 [Ylistrum balloti]